MSAPSPPANKKFCENEKNRPVHPVLFWNRTNWISGRKDGTGSRGGGGGGGGGSGGDDTAAIKDHRASEAAKDSTTTDGIDGDRSPKRAVCQVSGSSGTTEGSDSSTSTSSLAATENAAAAAGSSKRARQEWERPAAAGAADGLVGGEVVKVPIRYQFRAGYTNAVRRPVRVYCEDMHQKWCRMGILSAHNSRTVRL
ncbi:unnamed protein product [Pylaiella littoralis]